MIKCPNDHPAQLERYRQLVREAMREAPDFTPATDIRRVLETGFVDQSGHSRPAYMGLFVYSLVQCSRLMDNATPQRAPLLERRLDQMECRVNAFAWTRGTLPASRGAEVTGAAWGMLALWAASVEFSEPERVKRCGQWFDRLAAAQQRSGAFLYATPSDNPETLWYHELVLLHAAASYAAQSDNPEVTAAVMRAAEYHLNETQPDHATSQPWALLAFIWNPLARPLADQLLHSVQVQHPASNETITSMLLADCLYCITTVSC